MRPRGRAEGKASWALLPSWTSGAEVPEPYRASEKPRRRGLYVVRGLVRARSTLGLPRVAFSPAVKVEGGKPRPAGHEGTQDAPDLGHPPQAQSCSRWRALPWSSGSLITGYLGRRRGVQSQQAGILPLCSWLCEATRSPSSHPPGKVSSC